MLHITVCATFSLPFVCNYLTLDFAPLASSDDSVQCLRFSPPTVQATYLIAGSWDNNVRCWEIKGDGSSEPKSQQSMQVRFSFPYKVFYQMAITTAV